MPGWHCHPLKQPGVATGGVRLSVRAWLDGRLLGMGPGAWKEGSLMLWGFSPKEDVVAKASLSNLRVDGRLSA